MELDELVSSIGRGNWNWGQRRPSATCLVRSGRRPCRSRRQSGAQFVAYHSYQDAQQTILLPGFHHFIRQGICRSKSYPVALLSGRPSQNQSGAVVKAAFQEQLLAALYGPWLRWIDENLISRE